MSGAGDSSTQQSFLGRVISHTHTHTQGRVMYTHTHTHTHTQFNLYNLPKPQIY